LAIYFMFAPLFQGLSMKISVKNTCKYLFAALFLSTAFSINVFANEEHHEGAGAETHATEAAGEHHEEKFNAGKMIMEHILDSHDWHLYGEHHEAVAIPLPIILYTDKGLDVFLSSEFHHGEAVVKKNYNYALINNHIVAVDETGAKLDNVSVYDFSLTKNAVAILVSVFFLLLIFLPVANKYKTNPNSAPSGLQSFLEPIIMFIKDNVAIPNIGEKNYQKYMPFLLTVFFFILINNLMGLVPFFPGFGANVTGNISVAFTLAAIVLITVLVTANKNYWVHIFAMPGVPKPILIILTPIEILGFILRPFVLMMRLFANILAGHIVILSFISLIFIFGGISLAAGYGVSIFSMLLVLFMSMLELLVAFLQAYVFTLLSAIYFGSAIEEAHHDHH
jgi:F-type H+-transporting ATPase subunit a